MADFPDLAEEEHVWYVQQVKNPTTSPRRLRLCRYCRTIMATPKNLKALEKQGIRLACFGGKEDLECSLKAIALAAVDEFNRDLLADPENVGFFEPIDLEPDKGIFAVYGLSNRKTKDWRDIDQLELRYCPDRNSSTYRPLTYFEVYTLPGNHAADYVSTRPLILDMTSQNTLSQIRRWMDDCHHSHTACLSPKVSPLPTRVLDVQPLNESGDIRVHTTNGTNEPYACLSYCWGGPQQIALRLATMSQMEKTILLKTLPQTLQDAIEVTRKLGLRYLWVDSMCIIQDSAADMVKELKTMAQTYRNAFITISAASARSSQDGFLESRQQRDSKYPRFILPYRAWDDTSTVGTVGLHQLIRHDASTEPINKRAWTLQERLLSPRVLIYGSRELIWQCQAGQLIAGGAGESFDSGAERLGEAFFDSSKSMSHRELWYEWIDTVIDYTSREISFEQDKLTALSAVASEFRRVSGDTYLAGLWRQDLLEGIMWMVDPSKKKALRNRPTIYVAPSWSWASVNGHVGFGGFTNDKTAFVEILCCETVLENKELPTGKVVTGFLEVRGQLKETRLSETTLLEGLDGQSKAIGRAWMDAAETKPDIVYCMRVDCDNGLILVTQSEPSTFKRVGLFEVRPPARGVSNLSCDEWFNGCETRTITIK